MKSVRIYCSLASVVLVCGCRHSPICRSLEIDGYLPGHDLEREIVCFVNDRHDTEAATRVYMHYKRHTEYKGRCCLWLLLSAACGDVQSRSMVTYLVDADKEFARKASELIKAECYSRSDRDIGLCSLAMRVSAVLEDKGAELSGAMLVDLLATEVGPESSWTQSPRRCFYMSQECLRDFEWRAVALGNAGLAGRVYRYYALFASDGGREMLWKLIEAALSSSNEDDERIKRMGALDDGVLLALQLDDSECSWCANEIRNVAVDAIRKNEGDARAVVLTVREALKTISRSMSDVAGVEDEKDGELR